MCTYYDQPSIINLCVLLLLRDPVVTSLSSPIYLFHSLDFIGQIISNSRVKSLPKVQAMSFKKKSRGNEDSVLYVLTMSQVYFLHLIKITVNLLPSLLKKLRVRVSRMADNQMWHRHLGVRIGFLATILCGMGSDQRSSKVPILE